LKKVFTFHIMFIAAHFGIMTTLNILNSILLLQWLSLRFFGFKAHILCTAHKLNSHRASYLKGTCLGVGNPNRLAHLSPHLVCLQGTHLDTLRWTSNYAVIILINSMEQGPTWKKGIFAELAKEDILCNRKIHYRVESSPTFIPILSQINPVHTF
jgi:hypothetical protein